MSATTLSTPIRLHWDERACNNCMSCAVVCSERHAGMSSPSRARVRIFVDPVSGEYSADYCRQCEDAPCAAACPVEALILDHGLHIWRVDEELCIGCGECAEACQYRAIVVDPVTNTAAKCDLCDGALRCVEICATGALTAEAIDG